jgi:hypothetical protein
VIVPSTPTTLFGTPTERVAPAGAGVGVLRWIFRRADETLRCELGLSHDDSVYELRIWPPGGTAVELFDNAMIAFQRQAKVATFLTKEGWSLERFECDRTPDRHTQSG